MDENEKTKKKDEQKPILSPKFIQLSFAIPIILSVIGMGIGYLIVIKRTDVVKKIALIIGAFSGLVLSIVYGFVVEYMVKRKMKKEREEGKEIREEEKENEEET